jgi:hypothetical protein
LQKIVFILIFYLLTVSCSITRNSHIRKNEFSEGFETENILESVRKENITNRSFFIQKAEIDIKSLSGRQRIIGSIKFDLEKRYLISIKSLSGIEAARILISNDTVLINDRLKRTLFSGSTSFLTNKYGIPITVIAGLLGDFIYGGTEEESRSNCRDGKLSINFIENEVNVKNLIDCTKKKVVLTVYEKRNEDGKKEISFDRFERSEDIVSPRRIEYKDFYNHVTITILIKKFESPWDGIIEFIPGKNYKLIRLL